jgi:hypothetical protein
MSTVRQRAPRLQLPRIPAEQDQIGDPVEADLHGTGHGTQPVDILRNEAVFDGSPFRDLHTGQARGILDGQAGVLAGFLDAEAEQPAHALAA